MPKIKIPLGRKRRVEISALVLFGLLAVIGFTLYQLTKTDNRTRYHVLIDDVRGISSGTDVQIRGYQLGDVVAVEPLREGARLNFRVDLAIDPEWQLPVDSIITIEQVGLLSTSVFELHLGETDVMMPEGAQILTEAGPPGLQDKVSKLLDERLGPTVETLQVTLKDLHGQALTHLPEVAGNLRAITGDAAEMTAVLKPTMVRLSASLDRAAEALAAMSSVQKRQRVDQAVEQLAHVMGNLDKASGELENVIHASRTLMRKNEASLSSTLQDTAYTMQSLASSINLILTNLERTTEDLSELVAEIRADPSSLIRGHGNDRKAPF